MAEFYPISRKEMEELLFGELLFKPEHNPIQLKGINELVYGRAFRHNNLTFTLRVYSSLHHGGMARAVGSDAIRVCLLYKRPDGEIRSIGGRAKRVHRVLGWRANLTKRINSMEEILNDIVQCPACYLPMAKRNGGNGEFYGCTNYPTCKGTRNIG